MSEGHVDAYNAFVRNCIAQNNDQLKYLLFIMPHWTDGTLLDGSLMSETTCNIIAQIYQTVEQEYRLYCVIALFTLCGDYQNVMETMKAQGFEESEAYEIFDECHRVKRPESVLLNTLEEFAAGKPSWICAFMSSIVKIAWAQYLLAECNGIMDQTLDMFILTEYISFLMGTHLEPGTATSVNKICDLDLKGARLSAVEHFGEYFEGIICLCLINGDYEQYQKMTNLVQSNRNESEYAALVWRPFYRINAEQNLYSIYDQVSQMTVTLDLSDDAENECLICCNAQSTVQMDCCLQRICPQCLLHILREPERALCPFCRAQIVSVSDQTES